MQSLYEEIHILRRLDHPNIVRFCGGCLQPPNMFLATELMHTNLTAIVHREIPQLLCPWPRNSSAPDPHHTASMLLLACLQHGYSVKSCINTVQST